MRKQARWLHCFMHFFIVHIMNVKYAKFQENYLKKLCLHLYSRSSHYCVYMYKLHLHIACCALSNKMLCTAIFISQQIIEGLRAKRAYIEFFAHFHFFAGSSLFLADWLVLTWKASFQNCFCWFALRSPEITYAKGQFCVKRHLNKRLNERIFRKQISTRHELKRLLLAALTACFV